MKAVILNGCGEGALEREALSVVNRSLADSITHAINLNELNLSCCLGCDVCQLKKPGACIKNDETNNLLRSFLQSDAAVFIAPIRFGCYTASVKTFLDRTEPLVLPQQGLYKGRSVMKSRYAHYPKLLYIGIDVHAEGDEGASIFTQSVLGCNLSYCCRSVAALVIGGDTELSSGDGMLRLAACLENLKEVR